MYMPWHIGRIDASPAVLDILLRRIGSAFAGDILRTLALHQGCLESFWQSIHKSFEADHIQHAAAQLRHSMETNLLPCSDHLSYFAGGYSREQVRQIKYVVEVFYALEPIFAIFAALAQRWIAREYNSDMSTGKHINFRPDVNMPMFIGEIDFLDERYSACPTHLFYRALAKWPDYAALVGDEIDNQQNFAEKTRYAMYKAEFLAESINMNASEPPFWLDDDAVELSICRCREMSAKAIITATMLRKGYLRFEESERKSRCERWAER